MSAYVTVPEHVRACDLGPATVLVNYRSGEVQTLYGSSARWWLELSSTGDTATPIALAPLAARRLLNQLDVAGLVMFSERPRPWPAPVIGQPITPSWGTQEAYAGAAPIQRVPYLLLPTAALALVVVLVVVRGGRASRRFARLTRLLEWAARADYSPASADRARQALLAVRRVGLAAPGRVACLEESAAVVLMLALSREWVTWCHGVAADPIRLHAWVETESQPVAEPESTRRYTVLRTIPAAGKGDDHH